MPSPSPFPPPRPAIGDDGSLQIPEFFSDQKEEAQKRKVSTASMLSNLSKTSKVEEFVDLKESELDIEHEIKKITQKGFESLRDNGTISPEECASRIEQLNKNTYPSSIERNGFKRYKKILIEDLNSATPELPTYDQLTQAYADAHRLFAVKASSLASPGKKNDKDRVKFKESSLKYYAATKSEFAENQLLQKEKYCHISGWHVSWVSGQSPKDPQDICKVAHIVPHSLATSQTAYLFGTADGEFIKRDPKNSLCLHRTLEAKFDDGDLLILPIKTKKGELTRWECILADPVLRNSELIGVPGLKWKDIHKKELKFLNDYRPAARYMYYKYVTMFLINKHVNRLGWLDELKEAGLIGNEIWASPGPYLRKSYLTELAKSIGDVYLPEVYYDMIKNNGFDESDSAPKQSPEQEEFMAETTSLEIMDQRNATELDNTEENNEENEESWIEEQN